MSNDAAVLYSFCLYILYVLLPLIPAILIFRLFPDTKVTMSGPLQNLTVNATGAFAAYVVTVALGFFLVKDVVTVINSTRHYAVKGVITNLGDNQYIDSTELCSRYTPEVVDPSGRVLSREYDFVAVLDHPVTNSEQIWVQYTQLGASSGTGPLPVPTSVPVQLLQTNSFPQRFRLRIQNNQPIVEPETASASKQNIQAVP